MHQEVKHLAEFIISKLPDSSIPPNEKALFFDSLVFELINKYTDHWYPEVSQQGSAYRSISIWSELDPLLLKVIRKCNLDSALFQTYLSQDLTIWCDPHHVCYRIGDHGNIYTIYENKKGLIDSAKKSMAEKVAKSNNDFVISAYTTPVVIRRANRVETPLNTS
ncbi:hypothetical protein BB561_002014 [Smittium simulii]|uniref:Anti-proliferative protein domain-containing protein n=1 Tax=Smittium simulii TaxID=133385 RepID=A0A2T9YS33_9FUNG|nr:hypothetical protein BB561_002014 [Smittium simulii]